MPERQRVVGVLKNARVGPIMTREAGSIAENEIEVSWHVLHHNSNPRSF